MSEKIRQFLLSGKHLPAWAMVWSPVVAMNILFSQGQLATTVGLGVFGAYLCYLLIIAFALYGREAGQSRMLHPVEYHQNSHRSDDQPVRGKSAKA